jgi:hypothetical protein
MADAPAPLTYGTVVGHFISLLGDSIDAGSAPDVLYRNGTVTISTNVKTLRISGDVNYLAAQEDIVAQIVNGELLAPDGLTPLRLLATDSPGVSPTPFQYTAQFSLTGVKVQPAPVTFSLPGGSTVDLSATISVPPAPPVQTVYLTSGGSDEHAFRWLGNFSDSGWIGTHLMPGDAYTDATNILVRAFAEHYYDGSINWGAVNYVAGTGFAREDNDGTIMLARPEDALAGTSNDRAITPSTLKVVIDALRAELAG